MSEDQLWKEQSNQNSLGSNKTMTAQDKPNLIQ